MGLLVCLFVFGFVCVGSGGVLLWFHLVWFGVFFVGFLFAWFVLGLFCFVFSEGKRHFLSLMFHMLI